MIGRVHASETGRMEVLSSAGRENKFNPGFVKFGVVGDGQVGMNRKHLEMQTLSRWDKFGDLE